MKSVLQIPQSAGRRVRRKLERDFLRALRPYSVFARNRSENRGQGGKITDSSLFLCRKSLNQNGIFHADKIELNELSFLRF
jgi:hypothetical protein